MYSRRFLLRIGASTPVVTLVPFLTAPAGAQQATPVTAGGITFALPGDSVYPEGVAYDPATNQFFAGSSADGTIFRGDLGTGEVTVFAPGSADVPSALGLKVDAAGHLIAAGGGSGNVYVFDLASGALLATFANGLEEGATFINDVVVAPNGDVYVTDSLNPELSVIPAVDLETGGDLQSFVQFNGTAFVYGEPGSFNANGIAIDDSGQYAIVVQGSTGKLFRIGLAGGDVAEITIAGEPVAFGDGLLLDGQTLFVVRNQLAIIVRLDLNPDFTTATVVDGFTDPTLAFPTTIAKAGNQLLVANSQFDHRESGDPVLPFTVSLIEIPPVAISGTPAATPVDQATPVT